MALAIGHEHGVRVVMGVAPTLRAIESVVDGRLRARPSRLLPQPREPVGGPACHLGAGGKVDVRADRTPQPDCEVAQHVLPGQGIGHDVVQSRPESLEQECIAIEVATQQACAAISVSKE